MIVFAAGGCLGAVLTCCAVLISPLVGRRHAPPACPLSDVPPEPQPPVLWPVPSEVPRVVQRRRAYDWQRDGAA